MPCALPRRPVAGSDSISVTEAAGRMATTCTSTGLLCSMARRSGLAAAGTAHQRRRRCSRCGNVCSVGAWVAYGAMARAHILEWGGRGGRLGRSSSRHCRRRPVKVGASCDVSAQSHVQHKHDMCPECDVIQANKRCLFHKYIARTIRVPSTEGTETRLYL